MMSAVATETILTTCYAGTLLLTKKRPTSWADEVNERQIGKYTHRFRLTSKVLLTANDTLRIPTRGVCYFVNKCRSWPLDKHIGESVCSFASILPRTFWNLEWWPAKKGAWATYQLFQCVHLTSCFAKKWTFSILVCQVVYDVNWSCMWVIKAFRGSRKK